LYSVVGAVCCAQLISYIISLPEINVALVQLPLVPNARGHMTINDKQPDQHYSYIDITKFVWDCKAHTWRRRSRATDSDM